MTHKVQVTGFQDPRSTARVTAEFAQLFRITEARAAELLARTPLVIKEGLDAGAARKYRDKLEAIGLNVNIIAPASLVGELTLELAAEVATGASGVAPEAVPATVAAAGTGRLAGGAPAAASAGALAGAGNTAGSKSANAGAGGAAPLSEYEMPGFQFRVEGRPDFAFLTVRLPAGKTLKVEASAMATMDTNLRMKTRLKGGLGRFLTGESIFVNEFTAENVPGEIGIAPAAPGDLAHVYLRGETLFLQNSAFVACDPDVNLETKWQGLAKGFFSGESFFLVRASGKGDLWFNTYGGLIELEVDGDYVVDTGNIVAFTDGLDYSISKIGGYKSLFFSGEGLVCRFRGKGRVWIQTRAANAFVSWANVYRPVEKSN